MSLQESLEAMLAFLESNRKLDQKTFDQIEQMQVGHLLRQIQAISNLGQDEATALNERIKTSALNDASQSSLVHAISNAMCKSKPSGKRPSQTLDVGWINYLTVQDRITLSKEGLHAFSKLSTPVHRALQIGLVLPDEKTCGHIVASLCDNFNLANDNKAKHDLVVELKKLIRNNRGVWSPSVWVSKFPSDPRQLPEAVWLSAYSEEERTALPSAVDGHSRPGKWLRLSSGELSEKPSASSSSRQQGNRMEQFQQFMMMFQVMQGGMPGALQDDNMLNNLQIFGKNRKRPSLGGQGSMPALQDAPAAQAADDVRKGDGAFELPSSEVVEKQPVQEAQPQTVQSPESELNAFRMAVQERTEAKKTPQAKQGAKSTVTARPAAAAKAVIKPKAAAKPKAKAAAKPKAKAGAKPKAKAGAKPKAKSGAVSNKRPSPIPVGGETCYYKQGKIHRSDRGEAWRVFRNAGDRCDLKVLWKGNEKLSWSKALDVIDAAAET